MYKPFYFPGEIVRGSIILDLFNPLPKDKNQVYLRFSGREHVGKYFENVKASLKKTTKMNSSQIISGNHASARNISQSNIDKTPKNNTSLRSNANVDKSGNFGDKMNESEYKH